MSLALARSSAQPTPVDPTLSAAPDRRALDAAIRSACTRIAPLWPLSDWVAVNPFLGFSDQGFDTAAQSLSTLVGARLTMPRSFYREALSAGRMTYQDIAWAISAEASDVTLATALAGLDRDEPDPSARRARIATVAEVLDGLAAGDRQVSRTAFMIEEISKWCAAYYDAGLAAWPAPWRGRPLFEAWREAVQFDGNPGAMGVLRFREAVAETPDSAEAAIRFVLDALGVPQAQWADYLYRALFDVRGWAAYVRRLDWEAERAGEPARAAVDLLAIRVVWGFALYRQRRDAAFAQAWAGAMASARRPASTRPAADLRCDVVLQRAYEHAFQRRLLDQIAAAAPEARAERPALQAVFCIDVRSEVYRRALEGLWPDTETLGFAGFFGMPISYVDAEAVEQAQCPVLLAPGVTVHACPDSGRTSRAAGSVLGRLKASAVSCFGFVESFGLAYAGKLAAAARTAGPPVPPPAPALVPPAMSLEQRLDLAEGALRGMSLVSGFGRLVILVGHGASTVNNPHAAGLACGACAGHSGAPNARVAAALLNDAEVRWGLAARGIAIPADTWFAPALHDTTTDAVWLLDLAQTPESHKADLEAARLRFEAASRAAREERAQHLGSPSGDAVVARSRDWSQVRPEWGLARAAAFIAAPRALTRGRDLEGRAFLHNYDRRLDQDLKILELILTAPMIVASWISLQYYGSTVDNAAFGAGDKTLHNVCGGVGVLEGNAGDLRAGLPLQSVHDGDRFVHEPMRLSVVVAAEPEAISSVLARQPRVRELLDNGWIHLFAIDDAGGSARRYAGDLTWEDVQ